MFCKNCGQELSSNTKFCPGCGTAIEEDKLEIQSAIPEKGADNSSSLESAENNVTDIDSSAENKSDEAEKDTVQTQLADSLSEQEQAENIVVDSVNGSEQIEAAKSENSTTENIKEVLLPQKGKNGKVKFKDLSKKQKIIRIAIGAGLLLIALIWMISDGILGAKKAGNTSDVAEVSKSVEVIPYECDTGAVFDMTLEDFSKAFSKSVSNNYDTDFNLEELWNSPSNNTEDSGTNYQFYMASLYGEPFKQF